MSHWCGSQRRSWNATLIKLVMLVFTASDVLQPKWHISFAHQQSIAEVLANSAAAARVISGDTLTDAVKTDWKDLNLHISRPAIGLPTISISISYYDHNYTYKQTKCATSIFRIFTHQRFSLQQILLTFFIYTFKYPQLSAGQTGLSENRSAKKTHTPTGTSTAPWRTSERSKIFFCKFWTFGKCSDLILLQLDRNLEKTY